MIKSAAENIYPAEVEGCLKQHPAVADAAVIGIPDPMWTQSVKAIVVLRDGMDATPDELIAHCRDRIASYKKPKHVEFVAALPGTGFAVDYDALDAQFDGGGYPGAATGMRGMSAAAAVPDFDLGADAYRRRIRVRTVETGVVVSELEDDFHHFVVELRHDGETVLSCENTSYRWPWTTCPDAATRSGGSQACPSRAASPRPGSGPTRKPTARTSSTLRATRSRTRRGAAPTASTTSRSRSATPSTGETDVREWVDGELRLAWRINWDGIDGPEPPFDDAPWRGGFMRWADATLPEDDAECAIVLRRACDIGMGRGMDLDSVPVADQLPNSMSSAVPHDAAEVAHVAFRNVGTIRDFSHDPDRLLKD